LATAPAPAPAPAPTPAPQSKSNIWVWVIGIFLGAVALFVLAAFFAASYLARNIRVTQSGDAVSINTPVGSMRAEKGGTPETGLPVYPGATPGEPGGQVEIEGPGDVAVAVTTAHYRTSDPIAKVEEWYAQKLGPGFKREESGKYERKKDISGVTLTSEDIAFIEEKDDVARVVALKKHSNSVEIVLVRAGKRESQ